MDVLAASTAQAGAQYFEALRAMAGSKGHARAAPQSQAQPDDAIGPLLRQLARPELVKLFETVGRQPAPETAVRLEGLVQASIAAAKAGDVPQALIKLADFAALDSRREGAPDGQPGFANIRREIDEFMSRLASIAGPDADVPQALVKLAEFVALDAGGDPVRQETVQFLSRLEAAANLDGRLAQFADTAGTLLQRLSAADVVKFLDAIERPPSPEIAVRVDGLLHESMRAAAEGNVPQALVKLAEIAALDPRRAEALDREPGLAPVHREVAQFLSRMASAAHVDAESRLDRAAHLLGTAGVKEVMRAESGPRIAIAVSERLLEARGYANCVHSAQLSQAVIERYGYVPAPVAPALTDEENVPMDFERALLDWEKRWTPRIGYLWRRAPLLVLLMAWFGAGLAGGCFYAVLRHWWPETWPEALVSGGSELWGVGFLALVGFGFYARVRDYSSTGSAR